MGVGFLVSSTPWARRRWAKPTVAGLAKELGRIYRDVLGDALLSERLVVGQNDEGVWASWHPAEEWLYIELLDDGRLQAQAKTSTVGPGYHALLIEVLDRMEQELSIRWDWTAEDEGDESGFAISRDFGALQEEMLTWLGALSRHVAGMEPAESAFQVVCMPLEERIPRLPSMIATPTGPRTREWFGEIGRDEPARRTAGTAFFPWWGASRDASFWKGMGDVLGWCELAWVPPRDESERRSMEFVAACYERAAIDSAERSELRDLLGREAGVDAPLAGGIGYRRGMCRFPLLGAWTMELPGHFQVEALNDGGNLQVHDGRRSVYVSAMTVEGLAAGELIGKVVGREAAKHWSDAHLQGAAYWESSEDESCRHLMTSVAVNGRLLLLTITVDEDEGDTAWAWEVARSVRHPGLFD